MTPTWLSDRRLWITLLAGLLAIVAMRVLTGSGDGYPPLALVLLILVYPLLEEIVFRGWLQPMLAQWLPRRKVMGISTANVVVSLLFALAHIPGRGIMHGALVFWPSLAFGYFRDRHTSVMPSILLHVCWNGAAVLILGRDLAPIT